MSTRTPGDSSRDAVTRQFDTERADPNVEVVSAIADLEDVPIEELPPLYGCIDHVLEHLYSNPPSDAANAEISFTYCGYRVTTKQDGRAWFDPVE